MHRNFSATQGTAASELAGAARTDLKMHAGAGKQASRAAFSPPFWGAPGRKGTGALLARLRQGGATAGGDGRDLPAGAET
jgi:hypothetical protein